jgi:hypothetical protein
MEAAMTYMYAGNARIGIVLVVATILTAAISEDAVAKSHHRHWYAARAQVVSQQPAPLAPMRYYGGPKSPMWRG